MLVKTCGLHTERPEKRMELLQLDRDSFHHAVSTSSLDVFLDQLDQLISLSEPALVCLCLIILGRIQRRRPDVDSNAKAAESRLNAASLWLTQHVAEHPHPSRRLVMLVEEATRPRKRDMVLVTFKGFKGVVRLTRPKQDWPMLGGTNKYHSMSGPWPAPPPCLRSEILNK